MSEKPRGVAGTYLLLGSGMAIFGSGTPVSKLITDAFPTFTASLARMLIAALVLVPVIVVRARMSGEPVVPDLDHDDWLRLAGISFAGMFLFSLLMLYGMAEISGAIGGIVMATTPAVTAIGAILFMDDRLDRWKGFAVFAAVVGVAVVNVGGTDAMAQGSIVLGSALIFGAVCGEAAYTLLGKRLTADLDPPRIALITALLAVPLFAIPAVTELGSLDLEGVAFSDWLALFWWGAGTLALGTVLWYRGVSRVPGTTASAFMGVMPLSAVGLSYALLGESFEPLHAVGLLGVLAGIAAVTRSEHATE